MGLVSELHDQSDLLNRAKELSFKFLRRYRKKLQIIKADSLASLKQQIKELKINLLRTTMMLLLMVHLKKSV